MIIYCEGSLADITEPDNNYDRLGMKLPSTTGWTGGAFVSQSISRLTLDVQPL